MSNPYREVPDGWKEKAPEIDLSSYLDSYATQFSKMMDNGLETVQARGSELARRLYYELAGGVGGDYEYPMCRRFMWWHNLWLSLGRSPQVYAPVSCFSTEEITIVTHLRFCYSSNFNGLLPATAHWEFKPTNGRDAYNGFIESNDFIPAQALLYSHESIIVATDLSCLKEMLQQDVGFIRLEVHGVRVWMKEKEK